MSEEQETETIEFGVPLNKASISALVVGMLRDVADVVYEYLDVAFELAAAHAHWQHRQNDALEASQLLQRLLEGDDG